MAHPERRPRRMIIHVCLTHEILWIAISIGETSPGHSNQITIDEGSVHLQYDHVLVHSRFCSESRF
jgi:hypothetical protein